VSTYKQHLLTKLIILEEDFISFTASVAASLQGQWGLGVNCSFLNDHLHKRVWQDSHKIKLHV